jgi:site-specific DNA-adenine methylase
MRAPTIPYPGAKGRLAPFLVSMMPKDGRFYIEPFAGRGNVYFAAVEVLNFRHWWLNDIATAPFFNALMTLGKTIKVPERTREEYFRQKQLFATGDPRAILLEPYLTFSGGGYKNGGFGSLKGANAINYAKTLHRCADALTVASAKITNLDWQSLKWETLTREDFVFFDPPYYGASVRAYTNQLNFAALTRLLSRAKFRWMLTEYRQDFYLKALGKPCYTRSMQLACDGKGVRTREECVWKNF